MVFKPATLFLVRILLLCLASFNTSAEESFLLIDNTRGIDNTTTPAVKELDALNQSLQNIFSDEEPETDTAEEIEAEPVIETDTKSVIVIELEPETYTELPNTDTENRILLLDNARGIDNSSDSFAKELDNLNESLQSIFSDEETDNRDEVSEEIGPALSTEDDTETDNETTTSDDETKVLLIDNTQLLETKPTPAVKETPIVTPVLPDEKPKNLADTPTEKIETPTTDRKISLENIQEQIVVEESHEQTTAEPLPEKTADNPSDQKIVDTGIWTPQDSDLRILEIRVESYKFEDVIPAYKYKDIVLLPLGDLSSLIDLAIDIKENLAQGFIIKQENTFYLDTVRNEVILRGKPESYNSDLVKNLDGDIYVESNLLSKWLNMKLDVDLFASRIVIKSDLKLPFLARIEREERMAKILARTKKEEQQYPRHYETYKNYTLPFVDETLSLAQRFSDAGDVTTFNSTTFVTADLLQHESNWYLTMDDQNGVNDFRVTLGRTDPEGGLLGPINAKEYKFGHVSEPRIGLVNTAGSLKYGVSASSSPIGQQTEYDRHRFFGDLLPGWEVELYRNNALIGYQQTAVDGQYDFKDVPLLFGNNHFRIVFYGPKGEIKEENKTFQLSQALTKKGEHYYKASTIADDNGEQRTVAQVDYGISKSISGSLNVVSIPIEELGVTTQHNYLGASLISYWNALLASATFISDSESGSAVEVDLQTRIDKTIIGFKDTHLSDFVSEIYSTSSAAITRTSNLDINTAIPSSFLPRIPVTLGFKRDQYKSGGELFETTNRLSLSTHGVALSNLLAHQQITGQQATAKGDFQISTNISQTRLRGTINYSLKPENELTNLALTLDPGQFGDYRLNFGINHSLQQDLTEYSASASKVSGKYGLSFGARYNSNNDINLDVNFSIGFGYEPRRERWQQEASNLANQGSVSARFFLDANQDGIFNDGDEPLEDVGVRINNGYHKGRSDKDGILFLTGIPAYSPTNVIIASGTMADPLWTAALDGIRVVPRPGHAIKIDFPIFTTGEIDGMVELVKGDRIIGVGDVTIELVDKNNRVISTTETAYDGFYILSHIPMGEYSVRVSKDQLDELGLISTNEEPININGDEPFINGIDFTLKSSKPN